MKVGFTAKGNPWTFAVPISSKVCFLQDHYWSLLFCFSSRYRWYRVFLSCLFYFTVTISNSKFYDVISSSPLTFYCVKSQISTKSKDGVMNLHVPVIQLQQLPTQTSLTSLLFVITLFCLQILQNISLKIRTLKQKISEQCSILIFLFYKCHPSQSHSSRVCILIYFVELHNFSTRGHLKPRGIQIFERRMNTELPMSFYHNPE